VSEVYEFIDAEYAISPAAPAIARMCAWLEVSRSGYYEWRSRPESATAKRRGELKLLIAKAFDDSDGTYGYRRIWSQLARWGVRAGLELVRALMREQDSRRHYLYPNLGRVALSRYGHRLRDTQGNRLGDG
jgi:hypothetical protein